MDKWTQEKIIHFNDNKVIFEVSKESLPFVLMALKCDLFSNETIIVKSLSPTRFEIHYLTEDPVSKLHEKIDVPTLKRYINWEKGYKDQEMTDTVYSLDV